MAQNQENMNIEKLISDALIGYNAYLYCCDNVAKEAQKYIDFDDSVSCEYVSGTGVSILASVPYDSNTDGMPECVCPAKYFFSFVKSKKSITPQEFKSISV